MTLTSLTGCGGNDSNEMGFGSLGAGVPTPGDPDDDDDGFDDGDDKDDGDDRPEPDDGFDDDGETGGDKPTDDEAGDEEGDEGDEGAHDPPSDDGGEGCSPGDFVCNDGTCIIAEWECDDIFDCADNEDETDCGGTTPPPGGGGDANEVCYPGANNAGTTCFPLVTIDPYNYPAPIGNNYNEPIRYLDVEALDLTTNLTPNFKFSEYCVPVKGQYQVAQPHAMEKMQQVRNAVGALQVKSGFRSPPYNAQQPGAATSSRHQWGDAFDVVPVSATQAQVSNSCNSLGAGYVATYTSGHVHCDWRNITNNVKFFGAAAPIDFPPAFGYEDLQAEVLQHVDGSFSVDASGYDENEGELTRSWVAYDEHGDVLAVSDELNWSAPADAAFVDVTVGSMRVLTFER